MPQACVLNILWKILAMRNNQFFAALPQLTGYYLHSLKMNLDEMTITKFRGITQVVLQGSAERTLSLAKTLAKQLLNIDEHYFEPVDLIPSSKYVAYRVNNILLVSHGMGNPSIITLLDSLSKIMLFANNTNLEYIRVGTSGGIGVAPGSVVITNTAYMPDLTCGYRIAPLGKEIIYSTTMNSELNSRIINAQPHHLDFKIVTGNTATADDFYLSQARFDGAIKPKYTKVQQQEYFKKLQQLGIVNFDMEATGIAMFGNRAGIPVTMLASIIINRLETDQVSATHDELVGYTLNAQRVIVNYLLKALQ